MAGEVKVKQEYLEEIKTKKLNDSDIPVVDLETSDEDDSSSSGNRKRSRSRSRVRNGEDEVESNEKSKKKKAVDGVLLPLGFLDPLPPKEISSSSSASAALALRQEKNQMEKRDDSCKQFWKAGDFQRRSTADWNTNSGYLGGFHL